MTAAQPVYDVTIATVRPRTVPSALERLKARLSQTTSAGELLACWYSDLGRVNQIVLLRRYNDLPALAQERDAMVRDRDPLAISEFVLDLGTDTYLPLSPTPALQAGTSGRLFEVRTRSIRPGGLQQESRSIANAASRLAVLFSTTGAATRVLDIRAWSSLAERLAATEQSSGLSTDAVLEEYADIFLPAPFSPIG